MFKVIHESTATWPAKGPLKLQIPKVTAEVKVSPDVARHDANSYLGREVSILVLANHPELVLGDRPVWRMGIDLQPPYMGTVCCLGSLEVDALTGAVIELDAKTVETIQEQAAEAAAALTPKAL